MADRYYPLSASISPITREIMFYTQDASAVEFDGSIATIEFKMPRAFGQSDSASKPFHPDNYSVSIKYSQTDPRFRESGDLAYSDNIQSSAYTHLSGDANDCVHFIWTPPAIATANEGWMWFAVCVTDSSGHQWSTKAKKVRVWPAVNGEFVPPSDPSSDLQYAVLYVAQTLTDAQKAQARSNLGIVEGGMADAFFAKGLLPSGTDLDDIVENGHYLVAGSSNFQYEHNPLPAGHTGVLLVYKESANYGTQVMHDMWPGGKLTYRRSRADQADFSAREWAQLSGEKSLKMLSTYDYTSCDDIHEACVLFLNTSSSQPTPQITDFPFPERGWLITYDTNGTNTRAQTAIRFTDGYQLHRICTFAGVWSEWASNEEKGLEYWYIHQSYDSSNPASPSNMPINSYTYINGARLGSGWFGALKSSKLYFIYCYANMYNPAVRHYQVFEKDSGQVYEGYTINSGVDVNWSNTSGKKSLKVLQIGSSFGQDCCTYAPYIMEDMCDNVDVTFGILYYSGGSIEQYNQWIDNDFAVHYYKKVPGATAWTTLADSTVKNALKDEAWDVILFNQSAADGGNWDKYTDASSYVVKLAAYVGRPVQLGYLMPQKAIGYSYFYSDMVNCAKKVYDLYPVSFVIPAGTAIEIARGTELDNVGTVGHLCNDSTIGHLQEGLPCLIAGFVTAAKLLEVCGFERSKIYHSSIYPTQAWVDARNIPGFNGTSVGLEGTNKLLGERCAIQALKEPIESSKALVVQARNDYSSCDDVDESCVLLNVESGGTYTFSDFPFNEAGWLITIKSFAAYATRLQIAISFGSFGVKFRKCNISGAWSAWSTGGGGEVLSSCDLNTVIGGGIGFYLLISNNSYTHTPEGLGTGFLLKLTAGDWTYQIFFSLIDHRIWSRTYGLGFVDGVPTPMWRNEWTRLGGSVGGGNHYENTYNITCNPAITTDTNNYIASLGDATDMTGAIQTMLNTTRVCRLGPGDFYVTGIEIPNNGTLIGSGTKTRLILATSVTEGYAVKLKTHSCVKDLEIIGQTSEYTPVAETGKRDGIIFEGTADAESGAVIHYRSTVENVVISDFHGSGIRCENTGGKVESCCHFTDIHIYRCDVGVNVAYYSEYHRWTAVSVTRSYYGAIVNGGNNNFANCDFSGNTIGLLIDDSTGTSRNNSHGTFSACSFNHSGSNSGTAIRILGADNGEVFTGCQIFYGGIEIDSSIGIRFIGANIGRAVPIRVTNSKVVGFSDCTMFSTSENPITQSGNTALKFSECYFYNGDTVSI